MAEERAPISAELRRRVLLEAGHRCAIPTCRHIDVDVHHIVPWEQCKKHEYENLIALCPNCHRRAEQGHIDRKSLRAYKANLRLAHDKFSNFEIDVIFGLREAGRGTAFQLPECMILLVKRILDAQLITLDRPTDLVATLAGMSFAPLAIALSQRGEEFIDSLSSDPESEP